MSSRLGRSRDLFKSVCFQACCADINAALINTSLELSEHTKQKMCILFSLIFKDLQSIKMTAPVAAPSFPCLPQKTLHKSGFSWMSDQVRQVVRQQVNGLLATITFLPNPASGWSIFHSKKPVLDNKADPKISALQQAEAESRMRQVRSFVLRSGRLTEGQQRAMQELLPRYSVGDGTGCLDFYPLFGNSRPVILEIGFGNGDATWQMAQQSPAENFIGVEVHKPGVGHLLLQLQNLGIDNVRVACADGVEFLQQRIAAGSLAGLRLYFPDPWPKKRHHKRRIVQPEFVRLLAEKLTAGAILHLATDWHNYAEHMLEILQQNPAFENLSETGDYCPRPPWRALTKYEKRGQRLGHGVYDLLFLRRSGVR
jgi:tRNA (guanine-N7-)-methyltransferase